MHLILIATGGAIGAAGRYLVGALVQTVAPLSFPYGTFVVNIAGCLAFGLLAGYDSERAMLTPAARSFLFIGILGGFTTFSAYAFETTELFRGGLYARALVNAGGQVILGLAALWAGYAAARAI